MWEKCSDVNTPELLQSSLSSRPAGDRVGSSGVPWCDSQKDKWHVLTRFPVVLGGRESPWNVGTEQEMLLGLGWPGGWLWLPRALRTSSKGSVELLQHWTVETHPCFIHAVQGWKMLKFLQKEDQEQIICVCFSLGWCCYQLELRTSAWPWVSAGGSLFPSDGRLVSCAFFTRGKAIVIAGSNALCQPSVGRRPAAIVRLCNQYRSIVLLWARATGVPQGRRVDSGPEAVIPCLTSSWAYSKSFQKWQLCVKWQS